MLSDVLRFLATVSQKWPRLFSVNLAEEAERDDEGTAEQPGAGCEDPVLNAETVVRSLLVEDWTARATTRNLLSRITKIANIAASAFAGRQGTPIPGWLTGDGLHLVRQDPVMAAKFLQVVDSTTNGMAYTVTDPVKRSSFLGQCAPGP